MTQRKGRGKAVNQFELTEDQKSEIRGMFETGETMACISKKQPVKRKEKVTVKDEVFFNVDEWAKQFNF